MEISSMSQLLDWLIGAGGAVLLVAWAAAWGLEGLAAWEYMPSNQKSLIVLGIAVVLTLIAVWARNLPVATQEQIEPYATALIVCVGVWLATQTAHRLDPMRK